jgi:hypothetical protein
MRSALETSSSGASDRAAISLKIAAQADQAVVQIVEESARALQAQLPPGQGKAVDLSA